MSFSNTHENKCSSVHIKLWCNRLILPEEQTSLETSEAIENVNKGVKCLLQ